MKKILTFLLIIIFSSSWAQFSNMLKGKASCSRFKKSTTFFVLTGKPEVDEALRKGAETYWTQTPIAFTTKEEVGALIRDVDKSFVILSEFKVKGTTIKSGALALFNGGFDDTNLFLSSSLAFVSYDNLGVEKTIESIAYKLPNMVKEIGDIVTLIDDDNKEFKEEMGVYAHLTRRINENSGVLKTKTLLIDKNYLLYKIISWQDFEKMYNYNYKLATIDEIKQAITEANPDVAVLYSSYGYHKVNTVVDCASGKIIYTEFKTVDPLYENVLDHFDYPDLELLNSAIKKSKIENL